MDAKQQIEKDRVGVALLKVGSLLIERLQQDNARLQKEASSLGQMRQQIDATVEKLVQHDRIHPDYRKEAAAKLQDPVVVIQTLAQAADPQYLATRRPIGDPEKSAAETFQPTNSKTRAFDTFDAIFHGRAR